MVDQGSSINITNIIIGLIGGLAIFLYGLDKMGNALKLISSYKLKSIMTNLTKNRVMSLFTGATLTALVQSSSATTVLLVGFVSAEMISLRQALGVILGADIGTTITVQLIAFKITDYALVPIALGFFMKYIFKDDKLQNIGRSLLGMGLLFYGIHIMSATMEPLRHYTPFIEIMSQMSNPFYAVWFGALFTAAVQSSAATLAIIVALASQGLIDINSGIGLMLGANIGTCVTALIACIGRNRAAVRTAAAHVLFKIMGTIMIFPFLASFADLVRYVYPTDDLANALPRDIANAHLLFNILIAVVFLPLIGFIAIMLNKLIPDKKQPPAIKLDSLDEDLLKSPALALSISRKEITQMGNLVHTMIIQSLPAILNKDSKALNKIIKDDEKIDFLESEITQYLISISKEELTETQSAELLQLIQIVNDLESLGDIIKRDIVDIGRKYIEQNIKLNDDLKDVLQRTFDTIEKGLSQVLVCINSHDNEILNEINKNKSYLKRLTNKINNDKLSLNKANMKELKYYSMCNDLVDTYARIFFYNQKIAKNLLIQEN